MKRSTINRNLIRAMQLLETNKIALPEWGYWTLSDWMQHNEETATIISTMLGWDITDFGQGKFNELGAVLFTLRNGLLNCPNIGTPYAEKLIILKDGQRLPLHYHVSKTEDIINRAGGILVIRLYNALADGTVDLDSSVNITMDGLTRILPAGSVIELERGKSITLRPYMYHCFWAKEGAGDLVCGEVSTVNDDRTDNFNAEPVERFSTVVEDEAIFHPLCNEYQKVLGRDVQ